MILLCLANLLLSVALILLSLLIRDGFSLCVGIGLLIVTIVLSLMELDHD